MRNIKSLLHNVRQRSIVFSASLLLVLLIGNAAFLIYSSRVQDNAARVQSESQEISRLLSNMWDDVVRNIDIGVRGYALTQDEGLLVPYGNGISLYKEYSKNLEEKLTSQGYPDLKGFEKVKQGYTDYIKTTEEMVELVKSGDIQAFTDILKQDKGLTLWRAYGEYAVAVSAYQDKLSEEAAAEFDRAKSQMFYLQVLLGIIGIPTLLFMIFKIRRDVKARQLLFVELEQNNKKYLFDSGKPIEVKNEEEVIKNSIDNFKKATSFISQISAGNLSVKWEELDDSNRKLNQDNLVGELIQMREKMKQLKEEDSKRMWSTEGQAQFSEIVRSHQHELSTLCEHAVSYVVKYLEAQQGAIYLLRDEEDDEHLDLVACYAFDRKKFVEKRVEIGQGLVGQVFLEKEPVLLTNIPNAYTFITSGLGDATPNCLLLVPMKYNDKVEAVIEVAGFKVYEPYQLDWLNKIGEIMASSFISIRSGEKTQGLLNQFKEQAEQLSAQEEELRQNMEEMEATQEEMRRKEQELERRHQQMQDLLGSRETKVK